MRDGKLGNKAYAGYRIAGHNERRALFNSVGPPCKDESEDHGEDVHRDREELCLSGGVAEAVDDGGNGGGEAIDPNLIEVSYDRFESACFKPYWPRSK